ncbi:MAG: glycosyltransferase family 4 protein [Nocardioides sp.]
MRVGLDGTPLLGPRTGIGRYTEGLVEGLLGGNLEGSLEGNEDGPDEVVVTAFTWRGAEPLTRDRAVEVRYRRAPARLLQSTWAAVEWPPVELLTGRLDVFHGTNYVLPPTRRAAGVVTVHDLSFLHHADTVQPATLRFRALVPRSVRRAGAVCVLSETLADEVCDAYEVPPDRVVVTRPGVAEGFHRAQPADPAWLAARGLPSEFAVFVGSREPRKGLPVLLDAWARLWRQGQAPPLCLVGPPGWGPALDLSGLPPEAVCVPGFLATEDLPDVLASARLLAMPSRYEGFGIPPLEALATGTPVVVSDLPVFRENLGDLARYAEPGSVESLTEELRAALAEGTGSDAERARRREHAAAFTWQACARAARSAYALALTR